MNKISCLTLIWLFCLNIPVFAATEKVVLHNNKFGGITKLITYFNETEYNKDGIQKIIYHYEVDNQNVDVRFSTLPTKY